MQALPAGEPPLGRGPVHRRAGAGRCASTRHRRGRGKARRDAYHGFLTPCHWLPEKQYMSGMGYIVSWDVAAWIAETPELRDDHDDWEDVNFGGWLRKGGRYKNVYNEEPRMYDYWAGSGERRGRLASFVILMLNLYVM